MARGSPAGSKPEKTMSSRLLTMKFMQRAAATAAAKESPKSPSPADSTPSTPKRQRLTPNQSPAATPSSDLEAISAALAAEEEKRREAISRQAAEAGETEWVLDYGAGAPPAQPLVVAADSLDADDDNMVLGGRQAYGNFKRKKKTTQQTNEGDEGGDDDNEDQGSDIESMIEKARKKQQPERVRLSQLTSISGGRHISSGGGGGGKSQKKRKHK